MNTLLSEYVAITSQLLEKPVSICV